MPTESVPAAVPAEPALLLAAPEAARLCGISPATWHRLRAAGKVGPAPIRLGGRVLWRRDEACRPTWARSWSRSTGSLTPPALTWPTPRRRTARLPNCIKPPSPPPRPKPRRIVQRVGDTVQ